METDTQKSAAVTASSEPKKMGRPVGSIKRPPTLGIRYLGLQVFPITKSTEHSSCYDISANVIGHNEITAYSSNCKEIKLLTGKEFGTSNYGFTIPPHSIAKVPAGFILDIPVGYSFRCYSRSGLSLKRGLSIKNGEAIIDADYVQEVYILLENSTDIPQRINHGDRIAQGELIEETEHILKILTSNPEPKSSRSGGFGSTGT